jgi:hypothetical protein
MKKLMDFERWCKSKLKSTLPDDSSDDTSSTTRSDDVAVDVVESRVLWLEDVLKEERNNLEVKTRIVRVKV